MNLRDKNQWYVACLTLLPMLLVNPLFEWGGLPGPFFGSADGSGFGRIFIFLASSWGIRDALNGMLEISVGKLFPSLIYKTPPVEM
ncbi:hypothetical protein [Herbaspirillum rhizosphaerae]|uniref:hypothetical protein n=1 Tax=Herbaspirillum rhizosphaerae TaxID=346179 RepID=UPI00067AD914|nr:hypothetical protein [Herbaspirillum rhizosphaerae]